MNYYLSMCQAANTLYSGDEFVLYFSSDGVWAADSSRLRYRGMLSQGTLHLKRSDSVAGGETYNRHL